MAYSRLTIIIASIALGVVLLFFYTPPQSTYPEADTIAQGAADFVELRTRFEHVAHAKGAPYAFEVLRRASLPANTDTHLLGHAIGDILYEQRGITGITLCSQDFRNACSHTIAIGALNEFGEDALPRIRDVCKKAPGGIGAYTMCYHGLGHGIFAYYEYDLPQTIALCEKTGTPEHKNQEAIECLGGVIMELMGGGGHNMEAWEVARKKYLNAPLSPCMGDIIPSTMRAMCLNYLTPRLWEITGIDLGMPDPASFPKSFALCDAIPQESADLRYACGGGFGKEFVPLIASRDSRAVTQMNDAALTEISAWCALAPAEDLQNACEKEALASLFWGGENDPEASFRFCDATSKASMKHACLEHLATNINFYTTGTARRALCEKLPTSYQNTCLETSTPTL